ncbi:MAG: efflux RND transporter periplasmic adaptor subunit [Odoribacteraceae bacterium]|jgi:HlyD family secretion protein|nr:efflux RND transporter periplasmic adaptor subunit [Odoribacteraceae bacterium]
MKGIKIFLILTFLAVIGFIVFRSANKENKIKYVVADLQKRDINETIFIPGNVFPAKEIEVKSQLSGILEDIFVHIGDYVNIGAPVASIKLVPGTSDIERQESNVNLAQIDFDARAIEYERAKRLYESNTIAKVEMDEYTRIYKLSEENLISAKNQLDILKKGRVASKNISNIVISSTAGTVIDVPLDIGASVIERNTYNPGTTVAIVAETNLFKFRTLIAEQYLEHVSLGDTVYLRFNAYQELTAKAIVIKISSKGVSENGIMKYMLDAEFAISSEMPVLRSGYSATAEIVLNNRKDVLSVEEKHIVYSKDSTYLYVLNESKNEKIKRPVITGISDGVHTEIIEGVTIDEKVVVNHDKTD